MTAYLIVDQDRNFRAALEIALRLDGHSAHVASSAEEAVLHLTARRYDHCLVDAHLWGVERVLEAALRTGANPVLTGPHAELVENVARRHPPARVLAKPFGVEALVGLE